MINSTHPGPLTVLRSGGLTGRLIQRRTQSTTATGGMSQWRPSQTSVSSRSRAVPGSPHWSPTGQQLKQRPQAVEGPSRSIQIWVGSLHGPTDLGYEGCAKVAVQEGQVDRWIIYSNIAQIEKADQLTPGVNDQVPNPEVSMTEGAD